MKNITLTFILFVSLHSILKAQTFEPNFLGDDVKSYKGVFLKVDPEAIGGFSMVFYSDLKYMQKAFDNNVIYPDSKYNFNTVKDSLLHRTFKVENIVDKAGAEYSSSNEYDVTGLDKPILVLVDTLTKQKIYFKYDKQYDFDFPFLTSPIKLDKDKLCSQIERTVDDFTGETKLSSPMSNAYKISSTYIEKHIGKAGTTYYLSLRAYGSNVVVDGKGAIILFTDGTKLTKATAKVDVDADKDGYEYSVFIPLLPADLTTLSSKKIKKFRLYIYDTEVNSIDADKFKTYVSCITKAK